MAALLQRLAATAGLATLLAAPAFAQNTSTVLNGQLQWGDVVSTMNVVSRNGSPQVSSVATSAGNAVSGSNLSGDFDAESEQTMSGATFATATVDANNVSTVAIVATAQGNTAQAQTERGNLNLVASQTSDGGDTLARATATLANAQTLSAGSTAAANNTATGADHGDLNVRLTQTASNSSYAITDVDACCTGTTIAGSSAAANTYGSSSTTSTVDARYTQNSTGGEVRATTDVYQYRAYDITAASTAAANSASISNEWGYTSIRGRQNSSTDIAADTRVTVGTWSGTAVASAYGVGNTTLATNIGSDMVVDIAQVNTGGVDANAQFSGSSSDAGQVLVSSTGIGNAFTGYVCSQCGDAALSGSVNQVNGANITSTGTISTNGAGAILGSASAIGNSATFITTQRGQ